jgi:hypothetical protein
MVERCVYRLRCDPEGGKSMPKGENTPVESNTQNTSPKTGLSRRSFLKGTGAGAAGLAAARFQLPAASAEEQNAAESAVGPDPVPMTLRVNDRTYSLRLEPRVTLAQAMREDAPVVMPGASAAGGGQVKAEPGIMRASLAWAAEGPTQQGNVVGPASRSLFGKNRGDVEQGVKEADAVIEQEFFTPVQTPVAGKPMRRLPTGNREIAWWCTAGPSQSPGRAKNWLITSGYPTRTCGSATNSSAATSASKRQACRTIIWSRIIEESSTELTRCVGSRASFRRHGFVGPMRRYVISFARDPNETKRCHWRGNGPYI